MTETENRSDARNIGPARNTHATNGADSQDTPVRYGLTLLDDDERQFLKDLDSLRCAVWTSGPRRDDEAEFYRPRGWQAADDLWNSARYGSFSMGDCLCANTGGRVIVVDVDPRNGGDIDAVRQWLGGLNVRIFADVITPSGGRHFYIDGAWREDINTVHGKLPGLPGVDLQAKGANVFLPGTRRPKYDGKGYEIVFNDLASMRIEGDEAGAAALAAWLDEHLRKAVPAVDGQPWDGTPPDARQRAYLKAVLTNSTKEVAEAAEGRRNDTLNRAAFTLGQYVTGAGLDCGRAETALLEAAERCGLPREEAETTVTSGMTAGLDNPRAVPERDDPDPRESFVTSRECATSGSSTPPADTPVLDGRDLLTELLDTLRRYVWFPDDHAAVAVALWVAATHAIEAWNAAPRLVLNSPQKRCGKSRALDVISGMCHAPLITVNASVSAVFRSLNSDRPPTLIIDEADTIFGNRRSAENNEDLRGLLNAGHQRNRPALRCVGPQLVPTEFPTFAMVALAGIGAMPDTITDRAINITMRRRTSDERVAQFRCRRDEPVLHRLRDRLAVWAHVHVDELTDAVPDMPVEDRAADTWEPLVAVADIAGGDWPAKARAACLAMVEGADDVDQARSLDVRLLSDIRQIFLDKTASFLPSIDLVDALRHFPDSPWREFDYTTNKLAHRLAPYGVRSGHNTEKTKRGYRLEHFHDAFGRYLRLDPSSPSETHQEQDRRADGPKHPDT
ncbi:DUF3631 domain-containing protein [Mycobacterium lehmannii]|uniref:DUF3631 domain-containing protein n=1 Tax=Mycobacterium lehmannii TaxID=2048550 RepID=UPI000B154CED|nr:DUF3631 domain-containing protein [Mycobacterium lehmannii]